MIHFSQFDTADTLAIINLYTQVFSDSEGEAEGQTIGHLVANMMATTSPQDLFGFTAKDTSRDDNGDLVGCIFFSRFSMLT